ncbi:Oidioi.mRNA.OKI2018_I69.PAR.g11618.t3.cds [Oikopleura dioica]|uniref:Oidioi.mRNA.OKI2018_I69.PAR.g11618.t3.cds n=1 Tax=Oikopleura dioica TaxID=34765 RepID=A0ABN7S2V5_OIKDI|nr:Oidioi.mRNA.OKI2018_I69.PAR.g11618.t3.cds [Oikopleura dioica]
MSRNSLIDKSKRKQSIKQCLKQTEQQVRAVKTELQLRDGRFLAVEKGILQACAESGDSKTLFFLVPIGLRQVAIQNIDTLAYVAMNETSRVYLSEVFNSDCQFKEATFENYWCVYSSVSHKNPDNLKPMFLSVSKSGKMRPGYKTSKTKPEGHFLPKPISTQMLKIPTEEEIDAFQKPEIISNAMV